MGRRQTIDRDDLLDAAERVANRDGAGQLTIDAVAAEAGVSKGGVLYAYPSKDALIDALFARAFAVFDRIVEAHLAQAGDSPSTRIAAHVLANRDVDKAALARSTALITNFMRSPQYRQGARHYYEQLLGTLDTTTQKGRRLRLALLASEGAFMLQGFDFHPFSDAEWHTIHADILDLLIGDGATD